LQDDCYPGEGQTLLSLKDELKYENLRIHSSPDLLGTSHLRDVNKNVEKLLRPRRSLKTGETVICEKISWGKIPNSPIDSGQ
jgi:hypothetical protein